MKGPQSGPAMQSDHRFPACPRLNTFTHNKNKRPQHQPEALENPGVRRSTLTRATKPTYATLRRSLPVAWPALVSEERRTLRG